MATPIKAQDLTWLLMDRPNNLMQVNGLMFFDRTPSRQAVADIFMDRAVLKFRILSQIPVEEDGEWSWVDDPHFDLGRHVRHVELASFDHESCASTSAASSRSPSRASTRCGRCRSSPAPTPRGPAR